MEKIEELFRKIANCALDADEIIDFIQDGFNNFIKYFNTVYRDVSMSKSNYALYEMGRIDRDTLLYRIEKIDKERRLAHDVAIDSCKQINRVCDYYGVEHICPEETADRHEIADFIGEFVYSYYQKGINKPKSLDDVIEAAHKKGVDPNVGYNTHAIMGKENECR